VLKDADSKPVSKSVWDIGSIKGLGSVEYPMIDPVSGKVERKITFFQKIGDDVCGVGATTLCRSKMESP
jgi:hypothetical protein